MRPALAAVIVFGCAKPVANVPPEPPPLVAPTAAKRGPAAPRPIPEEPDDRPAQEPDDGLVTVAWGSGGLVWKVPHAWTCGQEQLAYLCTTDPARKDLVGRFAVTVVAATARPPDKLFPDADRNLDRGKAEVTVLGVAGEQRTWDFCVPKSACLPTTSGSATSTQWTGLVAFGAVKKRVVVETRCGSKDDCAALPAMLASLKPI